MGIPRGAIGIICSLVLVGCGTGSSPSPSAPGVVATSTPSPTLAGNPDEPVGVIAMGHSGLTGEGTAGISEAAYANSWATGDNPEVNSLFLRLVQERPENSGHVSNKAHGGASAAELPGMAQAALQEVPYPALAIIATIDDDIRCDGTDADHVPELSQSVAEALEIITTQSPNTKILVVGQFGRPSVEFVKELVQHQPTLRSAMSGSGVCDFYDVDGKIQPKHFRTLTGIIEAYEAEQARVCAEYSTCVTDGGARAAYVDKIENYGADFNHLNIAGQAAQAELLWPVVARLMDL